MRPLRVLDLFSGIGGFSLGLHRAGGYETVKFCEMKPHARAVLAKNFPGVPCHDDVTTYEFREGEADVITAGFPCQDLSYAGAGAGLSGERSGLYREVIRALRLVRCIDALLENVAALLSRGLGTVLGDLAEIRYDAEWHCIPARSAGAPHLRDRVWIIAHARGEQHEGYRAPVSGEIAQELSRAFARNTGTPTGNGCEADAQHSDPHSLRSHRAHEHEHGSFEFRHEQIGQPRSLGEDVADPERSGQSRPGQPVIPSDSAPCRQGQATDAIDGGFGNQWATEPDVGRVAHGVPARVDRLAELGNAVVPQIPEVIGRALNARRAAEARKAAA